jgi:hypothetical protein
MGDRRGLDYVCELLQVTSDVYAQVIATLESKSMMLH